MYKQVFDYNGNAYLVKIDEQGEPFVEDLKKQGLYQYTEIMPPSKLFPPRQFDGESWHGSTTNEEAVVKDPGNIEMVLAQTQMQLAKMSFQVQKTQKELADATLEIAKLKGE